MMDQEKTPAQSDCDIVTNHEAGNVNGGSTESKVIHKYKKRIGTSATMIGSRKQTILTTIILYRSLINKMDFLLGCNVDDFGGMGEICYRFNHENNRDKPVLMFIKTMFQDNITDKDLNNANSGLYLLKRFQDFHLIHDRLRSETDPLLKGNVEIYFVVYGPKSCQIKNSIAVSDTDKIFNKLNILNDGDTRNRLFQIKSETFIDDNKIDEEIEYIGKTIAAYITSAESANQDFEKVNEEMINTFIQYHHYLLPDVIKISDPNGDCYGEISDTLLKSGDKYHKKLKEVLFKQVLKKTVLEKEVKADNYVKQILLLLQGGDITTLIANGLTISDNNTPVIFEMFLFDELNSKLVLKSDMPLEDVQREIEEGLNKIKVTKAIIDAAVDIATEKTLKSIRIPITSKLNNTITQLSNKNKTVSELENQINKAKFLNSLYIYTAQKNFLTQLKGEIGENQMVDTNASIFQPTPDLIYIQLHYKVQKWWFLQDDPYYLTKNCDFLDMGTVVSFKHLSVLNLRCVNELEGYSLQFKELSTDLFKNIGDAPSRDIINIVTNDVLISSIKLLQFLNRSNKRCSFVDFEHVSQMKHLDCETLLEELSKTKMDTFVIVMYKKAKNKLGRLQQIVEKFHNKIVIVSKQELTDIETNDIIKDDSNSLADIENGDQILEYKIIVQGTEDKLKNIIDETMKHLIKAEILCKVMKQEKIEVGNDLADPLYEEIREYYAERKIQQTDNSKTDVYEKQLSVFLDIENPVVTIIAPPGMGKSKLLTHLSVQTKRRFPHIWIVRMNLLDYDEDLSKWNKNETANGLEKSMNLVCKAEVGNDDQFSLEEQDGVLVLTNKKLEATALLHLELIVDLFNKGYIYFIFDGFDEICPTYEKGTMEFMKNIVDWNKNKIFGNSHSSFARDDLSKREIRSNAVWITSRPYNDIQLALMNEFSTNGVENACINLKHLTKDEQALFYHKYWKDHIKIETLSKEQFDNINAFFEYMNQFRLTGDLLLKSLTTSIVPLRLMHEAAVDYFRSNITSASIDIDEEALLNKWISKDELQSLDKCIFKKKHLCSRRYEDGLELAGTPLHMQIYADLFVSEIMGTSSSSIWEPDVHSFEFYERFLETKFMKQFQEKSKDDVHSSDRRDFNEDEKAMFTLKHKFLAFYSFFHESRTILRFISEKRWKATIHLISSIKKGDEKTGLVDRISSDGVPHFVHLVFAEYFAVECIADILKKENGIYHTHLIIYFVFNVLFRVSEGLMIVFDHKLKNDLKLRNKLKEKNCMKFMFNAMIRQFTRTGDDGEDCRYGLDYTESTLKKLLLNESKHTVEMLVESLKYSLNSENIKTFINYIGKDFFVLAIKFEGMIVNVLDCIRNVNPSMILLVLDQCDINGLDYSNNEEILKHMQMKFNSKVV